MTLLCGAEQQEHCAWCSFGIARSDLRRRSTGQPSGKSASRLAKGVEAATYGGRVLLELTLLNLQALLYALYGKLCRLKPY